MTIPLSVADWRPGHPGSDTVVEVWSMTAVVLGYWDGSNWRAVDDHRAMPWVTRWRPRRF